MRRKALLADDRPLPRTLWYMGVKTRVIPDFLDRVLAAEVPPGGTVVDLMCGTGIVSNFCARRYRVLAGDAQEYARAVAAAWIEHEPEQVGAFVRSVDDERDLGRAWRRNLRRLERLYAPALSVEAALLARFGEGDRGPAWCREYRGFLQAPGARHGDASGDGRAPSPFAGAGKLLGERSLAAYRQDPRRRPACLMTAYYANVYFGLRQAVVLDSLRAAIDEIPARSPFAGQKRAHYLAALLHAASICTSGTSHFAQPRHLTKDSELRAMAARRRLDILAVFRELSAEILENVRGTRFLPGNRTFAGDFRRWVVEDGSGPCLELGEPIDLVYLDPPYTADNYSRFYHVLEVLARYDYPPLDTDARGRMLRGLYPRIDHRFQSGFCRPAQVEGELRQVVRAAAGARAKLVISYASPTGLLLKRYRRETPGVDPVSRLEELCRESYREVETHRKPLMHSGQGDSNLHIEELLVVCRKPWPPGRLDGVSRAAGRRARRP